MKVPEPAITVAHGRGKIQVAPGHLARRVVSITAEHAPAAGVLKWVAVGNGTFKPCAVLHRPFVRLAMASAALGIDPQALRRLCVAGFVAARQPAPRKWQVCVASLSSHLQAVESDREWWTAARVRKFNETL